MPKWDLLDDDEPGEPATGWDSLDDDPPGPSPSGRATAWTSLDEDEQPAGPPRPAPELTAAQLTTGEVLWARVDGQEVSLGSGQPLYVPAGVPDGIGGWRRIRITDAASLRAEVLSFPVEELAQDVADDPTQLFPPDAVPAPPLRPAGFPVGEGGDLSAAFAARVREAEEHHHRAAARVEAALRQRREELERQQEADYQQRVRALERRGEARYLEAVKQIEARVEAREIRNEQREAAVDRREAEAEQQMAQAIQEGQRLRKQVESERDATNRALATATRQLGNFKNAAIAGWIIVLILIALHIHL